MNWQKLFRCKKIIFQKVESQGVEIAVKNFLKRIGIRTGSLERIEVAENREMKHLKISLFFDSQFTKSAMIFVDCSSDGGEFKLLDCLNASFFFHDGNCDKVFSLENADHAKLAQCIKISDKILAIQ